MSYIPKGKRRGFTVIELLVSIAIMVIISTIVASSQSRYTSGASLKNVANDIGLSLRQAQIYGISVKELGAGTEVFTSGYGLAFNIESAPSGDDKGFIFFADENSDGVYDEGWECPINSECLDKTVLTAGNVISDLCIIVGENEDCGNITDLNISFVRPAIEAKIYYNGGMTGVTGARIELTSLNGEENTITVYTTGQISVK